MNLLKALAGLAGVVSELRNIGAQLQRLADLYEVHQGGPRGASFRSFYQAKPGGESVSYTNDAEMATRERARDAYFALTGIRLEEWELPPLDTLKGRQ